jgi:hypothetical protein
MATGPNKVRQIDPKIDLAQVPVGIVYQSLRGGYTIKIGGKLVPGCTLYSNDQDLESADPVFGEDGRPIYPEVQMNMADLVGLNPLVYSMLANGSKRFDTLTEGNVLEIFERFLFPQRFNTLTEGNVLEIFERFLLPQSA